MQWAAEAHRARQAHDHVSGQRDIEGAIGAAFGFGHMQDARAQIKVTLDERLDGRGPVVPCPSGDRPFIGLFHSPDGAVPPDFLGSGPPLRRCQIRWARGRNQIPPHLSGQQLGHLN